MHPIFGLSLLKLNLRRIQILKVSLNKCIFYIYIELHTRMYICQTIISFIPLLLYGSINSILPLEDSITILHFDEELANISIVTARITMQRPVVQRE